MQFVNIIRIKIRFIRQVICFWSYCGSSRTVQACEKQDGVCEYVEQIQNQ